MQQLSFSLDLESKPLNNVVATTTYVAAPFKNDNARFEYEIIRSKRRSLAITIQHAKVIVRIPMRAPISWVNAFILEKTDWINKQLHAQQQQLAETYRISHNSGIYVLDHPLTIKIGHSNSTKKTTQTIYISDNQHDLCIILSNKKIQQNNNLNLTLDEQFATALFFKWIKTTAENYMTLASQRLAKNMNLIKHLNKVNYRRTRSKWGHCTSQGHIQYNPLIMLAPKFVVDYIIAHEVCHLQHRNHSKLFWMLVEKTFPRYKEAEQWLKSNGHKLSIEAPTSP